MRKIKKNQIINKRFDRHGMTPANKPLPSEYRIWASMIQRCENQNDKSYSYYGGRGIKVCKRWHVFKNFFDDMGYKPTKDHSIDRINNQGDYKKINCRWSTKTEQGRNRRSNVTVVVEDKEYTAKDISDLTGIKRQTIAARIRYGIRGKNLFKEVQDWGRSKT